ncbi:MAG: hypothetical protein JWN70_2353 [Planctomycetaceae bacterium]|nr:hypothetical protein [Planctomycetaceae bacterium]
MGLDERVMAVHALVALPDRLRAAGFDVEVTDDSNPEFPNNPITVITCRRGPDSQVLFWSHYPDDSGECSLYIANAWAWIKYIHKRRSMLQADVTSIIEQYGGRSSLPGDPSEEV